jgi:acetyltransferase-like isoleucine patch superfamily enzyme
MTLRSLLMSLFPATVVTLTIGALVACVLAPSVWSLLAVPTALYLVPLTAFHLHDLIYPLRPGKSVLSASVYSPWWGTHQIQWIYIAFPVIETLLRAFPGLFSLWLRAWGSEIGDGVYWTPGLGIADRSLLRIGHGVVFGQQVAMSCHIIKPIDGTLHCVVDTLELGAKTFVGAGSVLGPGTRIEPGGFLRVRTTTLLGRVHQGSL